jgi:hypothetical protein
LSRAALLRLDGHQAHDAREDLEAVQTAGPYAGLPDVNVRTLLFADGRSWQGGGNGFRLLDPPLRIDHFSTRGFELGLA